MLDVVLANAGVQAFYGLMKINEEFKKKYDTDKLLVEFNHELVGNHNGIMTITVYNPTDNDIGDFCIKYDGKPIIEDKIIPSRHCNKIPVIKTMILYESKNPGFMFMNRDDGKPEVDAEGICKLTLSFDNEEHEISVNLKDIYRHS